MRKVLVIFLVLYSGSLLAQSNSYKGTPDYENTKTKLAEAIIIDGDTLPYVRVRPIKIFPKRKFKSKKEQRRYYRLARHVKKVYPYAVIVNNFYYETTLHMNTLATEKEKRKYINMKEDELKEKFEGVIREMTYTQGKILIKLINRETGKTSYEIVEHFKGRGNAIFWQAVARLFSTNLKYEYKKDEEDKWIEEIVARLENGLM